MSIAVIVLSILLGAAVAVAVVLAVLGGRSARMRERSIEKAIDTLKLQFSAVASSELADKTKSLITDNREEVSSIAKGLKDELTQSMNALREATDKAVAANRTIGATIQQNIDKVGSAAETLGLKTEGLAQALAGGGKRQGIWGEAVLAKVLDSCGLVKDVNYFLQQGTPDAGIPDAKVVDPAGRILVIDSKTSLTAYLECCNAATDADRDRLLGEHVRSVRKHVESLAEKNYVGRLQKADPGHAYVKQVAMFVPSEAAHAAAVGRDPTLMQYAFERGVTIVTPSTLQSYLRIVSLAWQQDSVERNHLEVVAKAELLLKRVNACVSRMEGLGNAIDDVRKGYEEIMKLMGRVDGAQSLVKPAQDLIALGVKLQKPAKALAEPPAQGGATAGPADLV